LRDTHGLSPGDRLLVRAPNSPELVAAYLAALTARLTLVPLDPGSSAEFMQHVAVTSGAAAALVSGLQSGMPDIKEIEIGSLSFEASRKPFADQALSDDIAEIVFTSGPTGKPRGAVLTHENILSNVKSTSEIVDQKRHWRLLSVLPLSHMQEQTAGLFVPLYLGSTIYYGVNLKPSDILKAMQRYRITSIVAVPKLIAMLMQGVEREIRRRGKWSRWEWLNQLSVYLSMPLRRLLYSPLHHQFGGSLEFFISGGAYLDSALSAKWERIGVKVIQGYGITECSPVIASNTQYRRVSGSVGQALSGVEVRLSRDGEIQVRGKNVSHGYWQDEEADRNAFTADGWFRTGDIATQDSQGNLFLHGHLNETIVLSNGMNVFPQDVEKALAAQEGVKDCVVLGNEDLSGEVKVVAFVLLSDHSMHSAALKTHADNIVKAANKQLSPNQWITEVYVWEGNDFPRKASGVINRKEVRSALVREISAREPATASIKEPEEILNQIKRAISDVTGTSEDSLCPDTKLDTEIGLNSLSRVELVVSLEKTFDLAIDDAQYAEIHNLDQLATLILQGGSPPSPRSYPGWPLRWPAMFARGLLQQVLVFNLHRLLASSFKVDGAEKLAMLEMPVLFIANHSSHIDTLSIIRSLPGGIRKKTAVAAAADYFFASKLAGFTTTLLLNTFPFSRGSEVRASLEYCGELAHAGWSILIYPEGTRSTTGELLPFKSGIGLLVEVLRVPVVPVAVRGGYEILPKGRSIPRRAPASVSFGEPIRFADGMHPSLVVSCLREALAELLGNTREVH
jgi:long-chain acyl-CoA synthetase